MSQPIFSRRDVLVFGLVAGLAPATSFAADEFPSKPVRVMLGATPGGSIDYGARLLAKPLADILKTPVIVENKPGGAGVICTEYVAQSLADGHTLLLGTPSPILIAPQAMPKARVNPLTDLAAINMISTTPLAIAVNPSLGVNSLKDLVARSRTKTIRIGLPLVGSVSHLVVELIAKATGADFLMVPYRGAAPALTDTIAGHVDATVGDVGVFLQHHHEGRLRIALVTSEKRVTALPDVPTAHEDAPGLVMTNWLGVFAPAKTPVPVIRKINAALMRAVETPEVRMGFEKASATATSMAGPEAFQKFAASEYLRYGRILRERNITIE